ncbi:MAG: transcriptional regulator [Leeuwenhoekiella sp.]
MIEKLGVHLESKEQLAPLAARILSKLILTGKKGVTFDSMVCGLCASKSTIFTHLTHLQASKRISYYTKPGDRKKYFVISPDVMLQSMNDMIDNWIVERELHLEIMEYKKNINETLKDSEKEEEAFDMEFHKEYLNFLNQAISSMQKLRDNLTIKIKND